MRKSKSIITDRIVVTTLSNTLHSIRLVNPKSGLPVNIDDDAKTELLARLAKKGYKVHSFCAQLGHLRVIKYVSK